MKNCNAEVGDSIFLACGNKGEIEKIVSLARDKIAQDLNIVDKENLRFAGSLIIQCMKLMKIKKN